jgi:glycosyltransferase involved in cell wall biosynthesis
MHPTGGPAGVNYRLMMANNKYKYIENMYFVFADVIFEDDAKLILDVYADSSWSDVDRLTKYFLKLNEYYRFTEDDVFFFHDVMSAFVFMSKLPVAKTALIYHQQGSLYKEWECFIGRQDLERKRILDSLLTTVVNSVRYMAFPSMGAKQSVIDSDPEFQKTFDNVNIRILYNGCDNPEQVETETSIVDQTILSIQASSDPVFISVADLKEAKGVERIPPFLADVKSKYGSIKWIIVGHGIKEEELEKHINNYGLQENVIWIRERIPHDDILALFMNTDFYIMAHRYSIFDFAIIEAMSYGNIPILTPIGGNREFIIEDNGIFLKDLTSCRDFDEYISTHSVENTKIKNAAIAKSLYCEEAFLLGYSDMVLEMNR